MNRPLGLWVGMSFCGFVCAIQLPRKQASRGLNISALLTNIARKLARHGRWQVILDIWHVTKYIYSFCLICLGICATIRTRSEIRCLLLCGTFFRHLPWTWQLCFCQDFVLSYIPKESLSKILYFVISRQGVLVISIFSWERTWKSLFDRLGSTAHYRNWRKFMEQCRLYLQIIERCILCPANSWRHSFRDKKNKQKTI